MMSYYLGLAVRSLRRTPVLSLLIVLAIGVGIGSSITVYSLLRGMGADPIPWKSRQLFTVQIDSFGPDNRDQGEPPVQLTYRDAMALLGAHPAKRQAAMYEIGVRVASSDPRLAPFIAVGRATGADFFPMFDVPFLAGRSWTEAEGEDRANVVVLTEETATRLFPQGTAVGGTVHIEGQDFRVVGVTKRWEPLPTFYDLGGNRTAGGFGPPPLLWIPMQTAISREFGSVGSRNCLRVPPPGFASFLESECVWMQFWAELPSRADVERFSRFVDNYAAEQRRSGRFAWAPLIRVHDVRDWLTYRHIVPNELRVANTTAFGFLFVCLLNAIGLMLARASRSQRDLELRRALGASRRSLLTQGLVEAAMFGVAGGILGFGLALLGLAAERALLPTELEHLTDVDAVMLLLTLVLGVGVAILAGLYPAWRASRRAGTVREATRVGHRTGAVLIGLQIALTLAIVSNAVLLAREHVQRTQRPTGLIESDLFVLGQVSSARGDVALSRLRTEVDAVRAVDGVIDAYTTWSYPLAGGGAQIFIDRKPLEPETLQSRQRAAEYIVDDHAARTLGLRLVAGRWFEPGDVRDSGQSTAAPLIIITSALARRLFGDANPVGQVVYKLGDYPSTIVGVVDRMQTPWPNPGWSSSFVEQSVLVPWRPSDARTLFLVRTRPGADGVAVMRAVEKRLRDLDPGRVITQVRSFSEARRAIYRTSRALASTLATVSLLLLGVTALGIVGLTTFWSTQRRQQIGVRRALGARRADILRHFQAENLLIVVCGLAAGSALALAINLALVKAVETKRMSALELLTGVVLLLVLAQLAALWPALRAAALPPAQATRTG